jgi:hypothetical protein
VRLVEVVEVLPFGEFLLEDDIVLVGEELVELLPVRAMGPLDLSA